jgi:spore coat protein U-like protein
VTIPIFRTVTACRQDQGPVPGQRLCLVRGAFIVAGLAVISMPSLAAPSCSFTSSAAVQFGAYDVLSPNDNINGVGSIRIHCQGGGAPNYVVSLNTGMWSTSYASRRMKLDGLNFLNYNLYTSTSRTLVWGDGSGGSKTRTVAKNTDTTLSIHGKIPLGQDVSVGTYVDSISATVTF